MMKTEPTPEQFAAWTKKALHIHRDHPFAAPLFALGPESFVSTIVEEVARLAYTAGCADAEEKAKAAADAELEACFWWLQALLPGEKRSGDELAYALREARRPRPKPLSEKAEALHCMELLKYTGALSENEHSTVVRALKSIPD
jgi:hypothetical protein